ncbi:MAG: DUF4476 domain-containing protein [Flavobacteriales bacterium]|jgi:hypothetical protein|nr:DUF4476 domain-containing protein [Flavobacteriales bacterium]
MARLSTLGIALATFFLQAQAQTTDLVFFTDDGAKFTLVVDGDVKNEQPATRVVATGIRTETPVVIVRFDDPAIPQLRKPGYFPLGMEYTVMVTTNKKGQRVLRPTGEAALGTAAREQAAKPSPDRFVDDAPAAARPVTTAPAGGAHQVTTVTTVQETTGPGTVHGVNMNVGVNGVGVNMNVDVTEGMGVGTTTTTTTTTTTGSVVATGAPETAPVEEVYRMPGYTGPVGCGMPMTDGEFRAAVQSVEGKSFEDSKLTSAKQVGRAKCFTVSQVKGIMELFSFEATRLDFAKFAYDRTHDIGNYYQVNDAFTFESSISELDRYIQAR